MSRARSPRGSTVPAVLTGLALAAVAALALPSAGGAEELEAVNGYAGTATTFHGNQELKPLATFTLNGLIRSS